MFTGFIGLQVYKLFEQYNCVLTSVGGAPQEDKRAGIADDVP